MDRKTDVGKPRAIDRAVCRCVILICVLKRGVALWCEIGGFRRKVKTGAFLNPC